MPRTRKLQPEGQAPPPRVDFAPGQITILANHRNHRNVDLRPEEIAEAIRSHPLFAESPLNEAEISVDRIITFERGDNERFSLVFVHVPSLYEAPDVAPLVALIDLIDRFNEQITFQDPYDRLALVAAGPNWLASNAGDHTGGGGPGGRPVPTQVKSQSGNQGKGPPPWKFLLPLEGHDRPGDGIEVAILDTAPCLHDLEQAYHKWRGTNELITSLLRPGGPLHISYASYADLVRLGDFSLEEHKYRMADHGLFVAGVIHSIAPYAELHLIEVLNPFGGGTLESVARGFERLLTRSSRRPLLVNCSLVVNIPQADVLPTLQAQDPVYQRIDQAKLDVLSTPVRAIFDLLSQSDVCVVAAAGNDADPGKPRLPRFPAAFDNVLGVGALQHGPQPAEYSNQSDEPLSQGIATFGGATVGNRPNRETNPTDGMLGIYSGRFPGSGRRSSNGWARWAGTSFATPVISGALTMLRSAGRDFPTAIDDLRTASGLMSAIGEVFPVTQG